MTEQGACILYIKPDASGYYLTHGGLPKGFRPTSELISHVKIHQFLVGSGSSHRAILHTHPLELIVLSHHPELMKNEELLNRKLWQMCPEIRMFVPRGIACCPYELPGSEALADRTIERLPLRDVILWEKHGTLATGETIEKAFDFLDVANKGAKLYLMAKAAGFEPTGLSEEQLNGIAAL
ncbi:rhamnulose-1-phosphate aldolase [Marinilabiliaceae bacterium JC017]|nr:rhamnulose-1-phosphate aldolase [Marinilabiliaceae bacterium JC017]